MCSAGQSEGGKLDEYLGSTGSRTDPPFNYSAVLSSPMRFWAHTL